jgi:hypothetical protein
VTAAQRSWKACPLNSTKPSGNRFTSRTVLSPGSTLKSRTSVRLPAAVMRMQLTSAGAWVMATRACPNSASSEVSAPEHATESATKPSAAMPQSINRDLLMLMSMAPPWLPFRTCASADAEAIK